MRNDKFLLLFFLVAFGFSFSSCKRKPPKKYPTTGKSKVGFIQLQKEGLGYYYFPGNDTPGSDNWGTKGTIECIGKVAKAWIKLHPKGPRIGIGDISRRDGVIFRGHEGHKKGNEIDVRLFRKDREEKASHIGTSSEYDRALTKEAILLFIKKCKVKVIYFNDKELIKTIPKVKPYKGHNNHFHIILE